MPYFYENTWLAGYQPLKCFALIFTINTCTHSWPALDWIILMFAAKSTTSLLSFLLYIHSIKCFYAITIFLFSNPSRRNWNEINTKHISRNRRPPALEAPVHHQGHARASGWTHQLARSHKGRRTARFDLTQNRTTISWRKP